MMNYKTTAHFRNDRLERATYIAKTVGFGDVIDVLSFNSPNSGWANYSITETGVVIISNKDNQIITMFLLTIEQARTYYKIVKRTPPNSLMTKIVKNTKKKYIQNQPNYQRKK